MGDREIKLQFIHLFMQLLKVLDQVSKISFLFFLKGYQVCKECYLSTIDELTTYHLEGN